MLTGNKHQKKKSFRDIFKKGRLSTRNVDDEALDASLMRNDRKEASKAMHFDEAQTEMLDKLYDYHRVDIDRLRHKFKKNHQFEAFIRSNQVDIDDNRTANIVVLGTSGSGKTKIWWQFLNYYTASYLKSNSWGLSPKDFYYIITEKIMTISIDILIEYNYHNKKGNNDPPPTTSLSKNDLVEWKQYKLELQDDDIKDGVDFFQDIISKLDKITAAINTNVELEEKRKLNGDKPNWDKIQELRNIEKEIKEFKPEIATKIKQLWKSSQLRNIYLYQYGLHNARNLFYYIDNIYKFKKSVEWQWQWSFEEILRCQIRTTGVIQQSSNLGPWNHNELEKSFSLKLRLWDVGGAQNERKKWKYILNTKDDAPRIDSIIFAVNLMSYYKKSWESDKNGLLQSLQLFSCLLSHNDPQHNDIYHKHNNNIHIIHSDPMALARQISEEECNICVDDEVKTAIKDILLFYIIFTDTTGLHQMLDKIPFKNCFNDYNGDNSVIDVQNFIETKFIAVIDEANKRTQEANGRIFEEIPPYIARTNNDKPSMRRTQTVPPSNIIRDNEKKEEFHSDFEISDDDDIMQSQQQIEGQKRLKCRFVSVIDHEEMKSVMNEIVSCSFLNKNALDPVVHSLLDDD